MTTFNSKSDAQKFANNINNKKGFNLYNISFFGDSIKSVYGLNKSGWYVINKETKRFA